MLAILVLFAATSAMDLVTMRKKKREPGSWVSERNRAVLIATSFSIFFGLLLLVVALVVLPKLL